MVPLDGRLVTSHDQTAARCQCRRYKHNEVVSSYLRTDQTMGWPHSSGTVNVKIFNACSLEVPTDVTATKFFLYKLLFIF